MMFGFREALLLFVIVLVIFGAGKLPGVMGDLAKGIETFKAGLAEPEASTAQTTPEPGRLAPTAAPSSEAGEKQSG